MLRGAKTGAKRGSGCLLHTLQKLVCDVNRKAIGPSCCNLRILAEGKHETGGRLRSACLDARHGMMLFSALYRGVSSAVPISSRCRRGYCWHGGSG